MNFKQQAREVRAGLHNHSVRSHSFANTEDRWFERKSMSQQLREERERLFPNEKRTLRAENTKG